MKVKDKLFMELSALDEHGPITIVALGDSVTHGSVAAGEINYETVYWNRLRQKLNAVRATIPVNVINAGIGGTTAARSVARLDRQVLCHNPDLVIVCFGLNDINGTREQYLDSLRTIFTRCRESGAEVIFMTPNMLNTRVDERTEARFAAYAVKTAEMQNGGRMDLYMESACTLAREMDVTVCDCYAKWKLLHKNGADVTELLSNKINHPAREMNWLFAVSLVETMMQD
jgi:lysophospholipase L1-like esterase